MKEETYNAICKAFGEEKPTAVKRPAKPMHRDNPNSSIHCFEDEDIPIFLNSREAEPFEEKVFTVRGQARRPVPMSSARSQ
jgi:hypothetical protein